MEEWVTVRVVVNHGGRRRGQTFATAATSDILALIQVGYLEPFGPAAPPTADEPEVEVVIFEPDAPPVAVAPRRPRGRRVPADSQRA